MRVAAIAVLVSLLLASSVSAQQGEKLGTVNFPTSCATTPSLASTTSFNFLVVGWVASATSTLAVSAQSATRAGPSTVVANSGRCKATVSRSTAASTVSVAVLMTTSYRAGSAMSTS